MSLLAPLYLLLLGLAVPILLLWMLRRRREEVLVPTNFLWRKSLEDERVSPLLRKLTAGILLLLQLAALALLALAAAEAVLRTGETRAARRVVVLLDRSASMGTREADGRTRLDLARDRIGTLLDTFRRGDRAMLVAFDRRARILSGFTEDTRALRRLLSDLEPADLGTDPAEGLDLAAAAAAALPPRSVEVLLVSDGAFAAVLELPPSLARASLAFVGVGETAGNAGIVGVDVAADLAGTSRVFVRVANPGPAPVSRTLSLLRDGKLLDAAEVRVGARSVESAAFDLSAFGPGPFALRLEPEDALPADDRAFFTLPRDTARRILVVTEGNPFLARLRDLHPRIEVYAVKPADLGPETGAEVGGFHLVIFDGRVPAGAAPGEGRLPASALYLDCTPPGKDVTLGPPVKNPSLVDWDRRDPLNRGVDWSRVLVARASPLAAAPGARVLLEATEGPLLVRLPGPGVRLVAGFRIEDTNLALRPAFPILFANLVEEAYRRAGGGRGGYLPAGEPLARPLPPGVEGARIRTPGGGGIRLAPLPDGSVSFSRTGRAGFYTLAWEGSDYPPESVAVSLLSEAESDVTPRRGVVLGGTEHPSEPGVVERNLPLRGPLLLLALAVLLAEWILWLAAAARKIAGSVPTPS